MEVPASKPAHGLSVGCTYAAKLYSRDSLWVWLGTVASGGVYGARDSHKSSNAQFEVKQYRAMASASSAAIMIEGEVGKGVSAYSLVGALRAMLGKPANREADSKAFNKLKETRPLLQNLPTVTISRRSGSHETPALSTLQQVDAVIDSMSYTSIAAGFRAQYIGAIVSMLPSSGAPPSHAPGVDDRGG